MQLEQKWLWVGLEVTFPLVNLPESGRHKWNLDVIASGDSGSDEYYGYYGTDTTAENNNHEQNCWDTCKWMITITVKFSHEQFSPLSP